MVWITSTLEHAFVGGNRKLEKRIEMNGGKACSHVRVRLGQADFDCLYFWYLFHLKANSCRL